VHKTKQDDEQTLTSRAILGDFLPCLTRAVKKVEGSGTNVSLAPCIKHISHNAWEDIPQG